MSPMCESLPVMPAGFLSIQQPRQMPLIMRSSAAFSRLIGSFGSPRVFSSGTCSTRGWRWPTGAGNNRLSGFVD